MSQPPINPNQITQAEVNLLVKKLLSMEQSLAVLRNQNSMLVNAITAAGFQVMHVDDTFILEPIKSTDQKIQEKKQELKSRRTPKPK